MRFWTSLLWLSLSTGAAAAPWIDDVGRSMSFNFPGSTQIQLAPNDKELAEGIKAFETLCLKTNFDKELVKIAVKEINWEFVYQEELFPSKNPVDVGGWNSKDSALRVAGEIFFNKKAQCNLTFYPAKAAGISDVQSQFTTLLGKEPRNADRQFKKSGKPRKYYSPEWEITSSDGSKQTIFARPSPNLQGAFHFAVLKGS